MIQTLIFDLGGVLIEDPSAAILTYCAEYFQVESERMAEALRKFWHPWHRGTILEEEIWAQVATDLEIPCPQCTSLWLDGFARVHRERPEMLHLLRQLKQQGYTTALLSNIEMPLANYFKQHPFADIDHCFYSCEMGLRKPEPGIYEKALQALSCRAEAAVFIDDRQANVEAANSLGISSILFRGYEDLREQLLRYHIRL